MWVGLEVRRARTGDGETVCPLGITLNRGRINGKRTRKGCREVHGKAWVRRSAGSTARAVYARSWESSRVAWVTYALSDTSSRNFIVGGFLSVWNLTRNA